MNTKMQTKKAKRGFTITELVIVIAVIAILAAVLIPTFSNVIKRANESAAMQEARNEWVNFSAEEKISTANAESKDFLLKSGDYYFIVENGQFKETALEDEDVSIGETTSVKGEATYNKATEIAKNEENNVVFGEVTFTYTYGNSNIVIYILANA